MNNQATDRTIEATERAIKAKDRPVEVTERIIETTDRAIKATKRTTGVWRYAMKVKNKNRFFFTEAIFSNYK